VSVSVELEEVVGRREEPPFRSDGWSAAALEAVGAAVGFDLAEDGLDAALAFEVERFAPVGGEHPAGEVIAAATPAGPRLFAAVGVGRDERRDALAAECLDRVVGPVAGVANTTPGASVTPAVSSSPMAVWIIGRRLAVSSDSVLISAARMIWPSPTTAWAL
jgi:hypothetical protein